MPKRVDLTVVIPTHNGSRTVGDTLTSLALQTEPVEIVVVDDGSTDETLEIVARHPSEPVVLPLAEPRGVAVARNAGLLAGTGRYAAVLDQDDLWHPRRAATAVATLSEHPGVSALVTGEVAFALAEDRGALEDRGHPFLPWVQRFIPHEELQSTIEGWDLGTPPPVEPIAARRIVNGPITMTSSFFFEREQALSVGGFAAWARSSDDWVLLNSLARLGTVARLDQDLLFYRVHPANTSLVTEWNRVLPAVTVAMRYGGAFVPKGHERDSDYVGTVLGSNVLGHFLRELSRSGSPQALADSLAYTQLLGASPREKLTLALSMVRGAAAGRIKGLRRGGIHENR